MYRCIHLLLLLIGVLAFSSFAFAGGSSVAKTVGITGAYDYHTLNEALTDVNAHGLADSVSLVLMDSTYSEPALVFIPTKPQPFSLSIVKGGAITPVLHVSGGGLVNALTIVNRGQFVLTNTMIAPDTSEPSKIWDAAVSINSEKLNTIIRIEGGGVLGAHNVLRGYDVRVDSSSNVLISGCSVLGIPLSTIRVVSIKSGLAAPVAGRRITALPASGITIQGCTLALAESSLVLSAIGGTNVTVTANEWKSGGSWGEGAVCYLDGDLFSLGVSDNRMANSQLKVIQNCPEGATLGFYAAQIIGNQFVGSNPDQPAIDVAISGGNLDVSKNSVLCSEGFFPAGVALSMSGTGHTVHFEDDTVSNAVVALQLSDVGELASILMEGGVYNVTSSVVNMPTAHNLSSFTSTPRRFGGRLVCSTSHLGNKPSTISSVSEQIGFNLGIRNDAGIECSIRIDSADFSGGDVGISVHGNFKGDQILDGNAFTLVKTTYKATMININTSEKILSGGSIQCVHTYATGADTGIVIRNPYLDSVIIRDNNFGVTTLGGLFTSGAAVEGSVVLSSGGSGFQVFDCHDNTFIGGEGFKIDTKENDRNGDKVWNFHAWTCTFSNVKSGIDFSFEADSTVDPIRIPSVLIEGNTFNPDPSLNSFTAIKGKGQFQISVSFAGDACYSIIRHNTINALGADSAIGISWEGIQYWNIAAIDSNEIHVGANGTSIVSKGGSRPGKPIFGDVTFGTSISGNITTGGGVVFAHSMGNMILAGNVVSALKGPTVIGECNDLILDDKTAPRVPNGFAAGDARLGNFKVLDNVITCYGSGPALVVRRVPPEERNLLHGQGEINSIVIRHNQLIGSLDPASTGMLIDSLFIDSLVIDSNSVTGFETALRTQKPCLFLHGTGNKAPEMNGNTFTGSIQLDLFASMDPGETGLTGLEMAHNSFDGLGSGSSYLLQLTPLDSTSTGIVSVLKDHNSFTGYSSLIDSFENTKLTSSNNTTTNSISLKISTTRRQSADVARPIAGRFGTRSNAALLEPTSASFLGDSYTGMSGNLFFDATDVDLNFIGNSFSGALPASPKSTHRTGGSTLAGNSLKVSTTHRQDIDIAPGHRDTTLRIVQNTLTGITCRVSIGGYYGTANSNTDDCFIVYNTFSNGSGAGLELDLDSSNVNVVLGGNRFSANTGDGLRITRSPARGDVAIVFVGYMDEEQAYTLNTFSGNGGDGLHLDGSLSVSNLHFQNFSMNGGYNLYNGTPNSIDATNNWWGTTNPTQIATMIFDHADSSALGGAPFEPFLADSLTASSGTVSGVVYNDLNKNGIHDIGEPGLAGSIVLFSQHGVVIDSATTDSLGGYSVSGIAYDTTRVYAGWVTIPYCSSSSHTEDGRLVTFGNGSIETVNIGAYCDSYLYRTFAADQALAAKPIKLKFEKKRHLTSATPNIETAVENAFARLGKNGAGFLGLPQSSKDSAKQYAWIAYKKAADLGKLYTSPHTGEAYPLDSFRVSGKKSIKLKGLIKADRKKYNNVFWEQGVAFRLNLIASQLGVLPFGLGSLVLDTSFTLNERELKGMSLSAIGDYMDSLATLWKRNGVTTQSTYNNLGEFSLKVLQRINLAFAAAMNVGNYLIDTTAVTAGDSHAAGKKNPYAVTLQGIRSASDAGIVAYVPGVVAVNAIKVPSLWDEEDASNTGEIPTVFALHQNYPNPFNPSTVLSFDLPSDAIVTLKVYNLLGQEVATIVDHESLEAGQYVMPFDASSLASGVYFYRIDGQTISDDGSVSTLGAVRKMLLVR